MASKKTAEGVSLFGDALPVQYHPKKAPPPYPETIWQRLSELPDLRNLEQFALDTEGKDEGLTARRGSSWPWKGGLISGVSVAWRDGNAVRAFYAPVAHPDSDNFDQDAVARWIADHSHVRQICHNVAHDWGWLSSAWGLKVPDKLADTAAMSMIVDENLMKYSLDACCDWRKIPGKKEGILNAAAAAMRIKKVKAEISRIPARYVGEYAEGDAVSTLLLAESLWEDIEDQGLERAIQLEHDLIPMCLAMRTRGVRVNTNRAEQAYDRLIKQRDAVLERLTEIAGNRIDMEVIRSPYKLKMALDQQSIPWHHITEKSEQPRFTAELMKVSEHEFVRKASEADSLTDDADKFFKDYIISYERNGRIHATINQYRNEDGGTRSYRFSYADPPLQQAPARDSEMAKEWRGCFEPEENEIWLSADYSQQEYRLIVHYAAALNLPKARESAQRYLDDPNTDFHQMVADWTGLGRKRAKDCNFAKAYGAGIAQFAGMANLTEQQARDIMNQYDRELPFVKRLSYRCQDVASDSGFIKLLDDARCRFDKYEPKEWIAGAKMLPLVEARRQWGNNIKRANVHKAMNRLIQGGAARQTKMWMLACWREKIVPLIQMHDELDFSIPRDHFGLIDKICELGREVIRLNVPMKVDPEVGHNWGEVTSKIDEFWTSLPAQPNRFKGYEHYVERTGPALPEFNLENAAGDSTNS